MTLFDTHEIYVLVKDSHRKYGITVNKNTYELIF